MLLLLLRNYHYHYYNNNNNNYYYYYYYVPVLFNLKSFLSLLLCGKNVFALHANVEALAQSTVLTEAPVGQVHSALLIVQALKVLLQQSNIIHTLLLNSGMCTNYRKAIKLC